jgi:hypothetical protein
MRANVHTRVIRGLTPDLIRFGIVAELSQTAAVQPCSAGAIRAHSHTML